MSDTCIKTKKAVVLRDGSTGALTSLAANRLYTIDSTLATMLVNGGEAVVATLVEPEGKKSITDTNEANVVQYASAQVVDEYLVAGNIKKDVVILGVTGTYEGEDPADEQ